MLRILLFIRTSYVNQEFPSHKLDKKRLLNTRNQCFIGHRSDVFISSLISYNSGDKDLLSTTWVAKEWNLSRTDEFFHLIHNWQGFHVIFSKWLKNKINRRSLLIDILSFKTFVWHWCVFTEAVFKKWFDDNI